MSEKIVKEILYDITDNDKFKVDIEYASRGGIKESMIVFITRDILGRVSYGQKTREIPGAPVPPGGGYPAELFMWFEIKDTVISLCEYVYSETESEPIDNRTQHPIQRRKSVFRMFSSGTEFGIGWHKEEDFTLGDFISFTHLKLVIKL